MSISWIEILCKQFFYFFLQPARSHRDFCCELPSPWKTVRSPKSWPSRNATNTATFPLPFIKICYCINQKAHLMPQVCLNFNGRGSWTRTNACWIQNPVPYQLGDTPINHILLCREQKVLYAKFISLSNIFLISFCTAAGSSRLHQPPRPPFSFFVKSDWLPWHRTAEYSW